jgi:hypothetical protein
MYLKVLTLGACLFIGFSSAAAAQTSPLFSSDEPIKAVLSAPITQLYRQRKQDVRLYMDGSLSYKSAGDVTERLNLTVRTRGNFRRLNCAHPPLRLNFKKKGNVGTLFEKQDKLKLVGPCKTTSRYQEYIGLEYLVYQIWQLVSPHHFKTRLVELSYVDTDKKRKPWSSTTFVIEDIDDVAKRSGRKRLNQPKVKRQQMNLEHTALLEVFQLLIGNSDYSTIAGPPGDGCCHNARLIVKKGQETDIIPVPYDFDVSGFVDAPYAVPAEQYPINSVRQRYFTGWCKEPARFKTAVSKFKTHKTEINNLISNTNLITDRSKKRTLIYVEKFYEILDDPKRVEKEIISRCRGSVIAG